MDDNHQQDQQQQEDAANGKRIYLGNLLYSVKPGTITEMLHEGGFGTFEKLHISVDPVSGRNPGYCFVDFPDKATADRALETLDVSIGGRPLKVRPCEPKKPRTPTFGSGAARWGRDAGAAAGGDDSRAGGRGDYSSSGGGGGGGGGGFNRWGDWNSNRDGNNGDSQGHYNSGSNHSRNYNTRSSSRNRRQGEQGPNAALNHFDDNLQDDGRRLFVGGLGKMIDQDHNRIEMETMFADFNPAAIGKRITARHDENSNGNGRSSASSSANRNFCFIDFHTRDEADAARRALDGYELNGSPVTVRAARRQREVPSSFRHEIRRNGSGDEPAAAPDSSSRAFASRDWRRRVD